MATSGRTRLAMGATIGRHRVARSCAATP